MTKNRFTINKYPRSAGATIIDSENDKELDDICDIKNLMNELNNSNKLLIEKIDNLTNYIARRNRDKPLDEVVDMINKISEGKIL